MNGPLEWTAAIGTMIAAAMVASDLGRRVTGWGFILFSVVAILWVVASLSDSPPAYPLAIMNGLLLLINAWGVWQYLLDPKKKREIEKAEEISEQAKNEVAAEGSA